MPNTGGGGGGAKGSSGTGCNGGSGGQVSSIKEDEDWNLNVVALDPKRRPDNLSMLPPAEP